MKKKKTKSKRKRKEDTPDLKAGLLSVGELLNIEYLKWFLIASGLIVLAMAAFLVWPSDNTVEVEFIQPPLEKTTTLQFKTGERYVYAYKSGNQSFKITYNIGTPSHGCTQVTGTPENTTEPFLFACISQNGELVSANIPSAPASMQISSIDFFQEWMLALHENWSWNYSVRRTIPRIWLEETQTIKFRVTEVTEYKGRKAFKVSLESVRDTGGLPPILPQEIIVDFEKRVLLLQSSGDAAIELVDAPFNLTS